MPRLTGTVRLGAAPADFAYVQLLNLAGDFQAEVRTDPAGRFVLYPVPGRWRLVAWLPGDGRAEREVEVAQGDQEVELALS
ncbi:MAG TPA: carboxypeptidase-like regulatory domain-containing protein [Actinomycetota bacterium]|nr:carboxypeptidase-like regulatory domain-containing protein [Actinomycetota bacterium]